MMLPELPSYLDSMGGGHLKGLIIALFTLTAGLSRPLSGKLTDKWGRIPVMIFGGVVCIIIGFIYPILSTIAGFFILRLIHGFSTGFTPTGISAYVADIVPISRRGEAMGLIGISGSLGMSAGPYLGSEISNSISLEVMFYSSSVAAFLSVLVLIGLKETLIGSGGLKLDYFKISKVDLYEPTVFPASLVMMLTSFSFGVILTIIPDVSDDIGIENRGLFFAIFTLASVGVRFLAGKASDRFGRIAVLRISTALLVIAMIMIAQVQTENEMIMAAIVFGIAAGMNSPSIFAWTVDLAPDHYRGRGLATMFIALEIGIGSGAFLSGWIYANELTNAPKAFYLSAIIALCAFIYVLPRISGWRIKEA